MLLASSKTSIISRPLMVKMERNFGRMFPECKEKGIRHLPPLVCLTSQEVRYVLAERFFVIHCDIGSLFTEEGSCIARTWN